MVRTAIKSLPFSELITYSGGDFARGDIDLGKICNNPGASRLGVRGDFVGGNFVGGKLARGRDKQPHQCQIQTLIE